MIFMDASTLSSVRDLGIAIVAVLAMGYLFKYHIDNTKESFTALVGQLEKNRLDYTEFVETNNHGNTERIEKSTEAMVKVSEAIDKHNQILERLIVKMDK